MKQLSQDAFLLAKSYLMSSGRPLDRRLFAYHFESGLKEDVLEALFDFQNDDGGFGHGLEPDLRTPASSGLATSTAFEIMREVGAVALGPLVEPAINYLLKSHDEEKQVWPIIPPESEGSPHAPWWDYGESEKMFDGFLSNPRPAIVGHLNHYSELVPRQFLEEITAATVAHMEGLPDDQMNMHDLACYLSLAEADNLPATRREQVLRKLYKVTPGSVETDLANWTTYGLRPLGVAPSPTSPLAEVVGLEAIEANLDYEIGTQLVDGSWPLPWSWGDLYPEAWSQAERDWKGHQIVQKLVIFKAYGRLS